MKETRPGYNLFLLKIPHRAFSRYTVFALGLCLLMGAGWHFWLSPTRIALINFTENRYAQITEANDNRFIRIDRLSPEKAAEKNLTSFAAVYYMKRGGKPTPKETVKIRKTLGKKTPFLVFSSAGQGSDITNLNKTQAHDLTAYIKNGGLVNLRAFLNYNRRILDKKKIFGKPFSKPFELPEDVFFHTKADAFFETYKEYQAYYESRGLFSKGRPRVCLTVYGWGLNSANRGYVNELIHILEERNINLYPIAGRKKRLEFIKQIEPDLIITTSLGRLGRNDTAKSLLLLQDLNAPLLHPVDIHRPYEQWKKDQRGIRGGLLSQQIVIPEMDGAIEPFSISALFANKNGHYRLEEISGRLNAMVDRVEKWLILRQKQNSEKRVAVIYFKGPGQNAMRAAGLDVVPSLLNLLRHLKKSGFNTGPLPETADELAKQIQRRGPLLGHYAKGAFNDFLSHGDPEFIPAKTYISWCKKMLSPAVYESVEKLYGPAPGKYLTISHEGTSYIALPRLEFGNIVLIPQLPPALGDDRFKLVHGVKKPPPHPYIATYLWARAGFKADALIHFGTHGSLEFTPWRQTALSSDDWPDALIGNLPHLYLYVINNIGEAVIAKRRSYATIDSHLTPPFTESGLYGQFTGLLPAVHGYMHSENPALKEQYKKTIFSIVMKTKLEKDLGIDLFDEEKLTREVIKKVHQYAHSIEQEKITSGLYTLGMPYSPEKIKETAGLMAIDPLSFSMAGMDVARGKIRADQIKDLHFFEENYKEKAFKIIDQILSGKKTPEAYLDQTDMDSLKTAFHKNRKFVEALRTYKDTLHAIQGYKSGLEQSPVNELNTVINFLSGGYVSPSSGGDAITNPGAIPTGRNMFSIDVEMTPTSEAWEVGVKLAKETINRKVEKTGMFPKKIAITLWGGEFIRSKGVELAMIFYFLGVEPVRSARGQIVDVRLIPAKELKRPRIDVVVQTSGQFRDIAASRIFLINRAVDLASDAYDAPGSINHVREGTLLAEKVMKQKGISPLDARAFSRARVFGSVDGNYGTGIMGLVEAGDRWQNNEEIADRYLKNMGAIYTKEHWGYYKPGIFEGALQQTDTVVHKRSSNVWGPLSLDHVYEFMGGISATVRQVTGNDPDAYFTDLRNRHNAMVQGAKEAIWTETRSSVMNPKYIKELQKSGAFAAEKFANIFRNTYGWNVMKPAEIDTELWEGLHDVYIKDTQNLGMEKYFRAKNPFALQEMSAVMLETIRKGYWKPDQKIIKNLAKLHAGLVKDFKPGCSVFVCDNTKLRNMISGLLSPALSSAYNADISQVRIGTDNPKIKGLKLEKEIFQLEKAKQVVSQNVSAIFTLLSIVAVFAAAVIIGVRRQQG